MNKLHAKWILPCSITAALVLAPWANAGQSVDRTVDTTDAPTVTIEIDSGSLKVVGWDQDQVQVIGELGDQVETFEVELKSPNSVDIEVEDADGGWEWKREDNELEVRLPRGSRVSVEFINGSVSVEGVSGALDVEGINGSIDARAITGLVSLETVNGSIVTEQIDGDMELETVNGPVTVKEHRGKRLQLTAVNGPLTVDSAAVEIDLDSVSGPTRLTLADVDRFAATTIAGDIKGQMHLQKNANFEVETVSGRVRLTLIEPLDISVNVESMTGNIDNDINSVEPTKGDFGLGRSLTFSEGDASAEVRITTVSGEIDLSKE